MDELIETDVLIIGSGIAGGTAAWQLADAGIPVTIVTRASELKESNTYYAQGGIIYQGLEDSPELLGEDILRAGAGHCNPRAVRILAEEGPALVGKILIEKVGVQFDRDHGALSLAREGGHSIPRIVHAADATGKAIEAALMEKVKAHPNVHMLIGFTAIDLLTPSHHSLNRLSVYDP
ncbi:MAG TPA: FAD-dependent oxidoreductase, partial [Anaerolineae bacterium]